MSSHRQRIFNLVFSSVQLLILRSRKLFLGRALDKQGKPDEAAKAYESATRIKPNDDQAWQGLRSVYEAQGPRKVDEYIPVGLRLAEIYAAALVLAPPRIYGSGPRSDNMRVETIGTDVKPA